MSAWMLKIWIHFSFWTWDIALLGFSHPRDIFALKIHFIFMHACVCILHSPYIATLDCYILSFDVEFHHHKFWYRLYAQTTIPNYHELGMRHCLHMNHECTTENRTGPLIRVIGFENVTNIISKAEFQPSWFWDERFWLGKYFSKSSTIWTHYIAHAFSWIAFETPRYMRVQTRNILITNITVLSSEMHVSPSTRVKISHLVKKLCSQQACNKLVNKL